MYVPPLSRWTDRDDLLAGIAAIRLATLITAVDGRYHASIVPMVARRAGEDVFLETHLAKASPHAALLARPHRSLALFRGPDAYVSPSYYPSKAEHGRVVPTWAYTAIEAQGIACPIENRAALIAHLSHLTEVNEAERAQPWSVTDAPADFLDKLSRAVIGISLQVETLEGAKKLNQHKPDGDRAGAIAGLAQSPRIGEPEVAALMRSLEQARGG